MNALVIEDDPNLSRLIASWLVGCGYDVKTVDNLAEAERCIEEAPDISVITLDLNLTDSNYQNTIPRIKSIREHNPNALLVVISGVITRNDEKLVTSLGADAMLEKHEIPTEKTFLGKLSDMVSALFKTPTGFQNRATVLQGIANKVARRCDALGCSIGQSLVNSDEAGPVQPAKEHLPPVQD